VLRRVVAASQVRLILEAVGLMNFVEQLQHFPLPRQEGLVGWKEISVSLRDLNTADRSTGSVRSYSRHELNCMQISAFILRHIMKTRSSRWMRMNKPAEWVSKVINSLALESVGSTSLAQKP
jgi:hypothetical protein